MNKTPAQEENPETLALFLNLAMEDIDSNPSSLQPYTEEMAAEDDELLSGAEDAALPSPVESFRKSWEEAMTEQVKPISQLWDNPYDPLFDEDEPSERLPLNADPSDIPKSVEVDWGKPQGVEVW